MARGWEAIAQAKVRAFLQWGRYIRTATAKEVLYVNMDETSMAFSYAGQVGNLISKKSLPPGRRRRREQCSLSDTRARFSFLAFITHCTMLQALLPQIVIGNQRQFTKKVMADLAPHVPKNFFVWSQESAWNSHAGMRRVLRLLVNCLGDVLLTRQLVLLVDMAKCHIHSTIFAEAAKLGVRVMYVPAKLTWLLQPADTHLFSMLKRRVKLRWLQMRVASKDGKISHTSWVKALLALLKQILCGKAWKPAFEAAGLLGPEALSVRVLKELGWPAPKPISDDRLSVEQVKLVFPKRTRVNADTVFNWAKAKAKAKAKVKAKAKAAAAAPMLD
jgi:hypothetical protein